MDAEGRTTTVRWTAVEALGEVDPRRGGAARVRRLRERDGAELPAPW